MRERYRVETRLVDTFSEEVLTSRTIETFDTATEADTFIGCMDDVIADTIERIAEDTMEEL